VRIQEKLEKIQLPKMYKRSGKDCFLDPYRKRLIEVTPEEVVRQKVAKYCEEELKVPAEYIMLEMPMSKYVEGSRGRADIVIHQKAEDNVLYPLMIVECKKTDVFLTAKVTEQAAGYSNIVGADYFVITNGIEMETFKYNEELNQYQRLETIPSYEEMIARSGAVMPMEEKPPRFTLEQLHDLELMKEYSESDVWIYGGDTPTKFISFVVNLYQALLDEEHKLPTAKFENYEMLEDLGVRYYDYSDGGGGHFNGLYRSFLVRENNGESQILSFSIFGTSNAVPNDPVNVHRKSYTSFLVAIDKFKVSRPILELNIDTFVTLINGQAIFKHNGRMSRLPSEELRVFVDDNSELVHIENNMMNLGWLPTDRLLYMDGQEESRLIYAIMEYALIREKYRSGKLK
jgi:hypothetical protein